MKKNFMAIVSLLIAAMLLMVSCAPEAKVEDGLVNASFGVAYGKDVTVAVNDNVTIYYTYTLEAKWGDLGSGADKYAEKTSGVIGPKTIGSDIGSIDLGYVTPGLWEITVVGKIGDANGTEVMKGVTRAYFRNAGTNVNESKTATVYVAPVNSVNTGKLSISIKMEDLGDSTANAISYALDGGAATPLTRTNNPTNHVYSYQADLTNVSSGYHFITFTVPGFDGGVTKSFLMLPGSAATTGGKDVTISGSIIPSKFVDSNASITVISLGQKNITIGDKVFSGSESPKEVAGGNVDVSIEAFTTPIAPDGATEVSDNVSYQWYLDGKKYGSAIEGTASTKINVPTAPGYYNITCIATFSYKLDGVQYNIYGSETQTAIVFVAPPAQSGSTPGTGNSGSTPGTGEGGSTT